MNILSNKTHYELFAGNVTRDQFQPRLELKLYYRGDFLVDGGKFSGRFRENLKNNRYKEQNPKTHATRKF